MLDTSVYVSCLLAKNVKRTWKFNCVYTQQSVRLSKTRLGYSERRYCAAPGMRRRTTARTTVIFCFSGNHHPRTHNKI